MSERSRPSARRITSRRGVLLGATAAVIFAALPKSAQAQPDQEFKFPDEERQAIKKENAPIVELFPAASRNYDLITIPNKKLSGRIFCEVHPNKDRSLGVILGYPNTDPKTLKNGRVIAWHEIAGHGFDLSQESRPSMYVAQHFDPLFKSLIQAPEFQVEKYLPITEDSYMQEEEITIGHPWDNWGETFASASTVARYYMNQLLTELTHQPEVAPLVANTVLRTIESYSKFAAVPINVGDLPYDRKAILELQRIGQRRQIILQENA